MTPPFLIVTPTLGTSPYLDRTVASVAALNLPCQHVMVAPANRIDELRRRYPSARLVADRGPAGGIYGALNDAIGAAPPGWKWFTYINDDDALLPPFRAVALRHLLRPSSEPVVYGDVALIDGSGRRVALVTTERHPARIPALLQEGISPLNQQGMLIRRDVVEALGGFDTRYRLCADLDFWLRAYVSGARFRYVPEVLAEFRLREGQLSADTAVTQAEMAEIVRRHCAAPVRPVRRRVIRIGYRLQNLPRYLARWRSRGWRTSYQLLGQAPSRTP